MDKDILGKDVYHTIEQVVHPEISRTLVELGMVKDIAVKHSEVVLTLMLPFLGIPASIKDYLVNSLREAAMKLDVNVEVKIEEMNEEERLAFLAMAQEVPKSL